VPHVRGPAGPDAELVGVDALGPAPATQRLRVLRREPGLAIVHHADEHGTWATRGRDVLHQTAPTEPWRRVTRLPRSRLDPLLGSRLASRALRIDRCNVRPGAEGRLLAIRGGRVYRIEDGACEELCTIQGDCLMNRAIAEGSDGSLYFGEYFTNSERRPVRIWRITGDLRAAEVAFEFERPRVRHVHAVHADPDVPGRLWATTGDFADECFLFFSDDGFRSVERVGDGGQTFRAVGLVFQPERIVWLTDSHVEQNRIVSLERRSGELRFHGELPSSTWYTARTSDGVLLATTTVEPGAAIRTRRARLLRSSDGLAWREALAFDKDRLPMRFFKFGSLALPSGRFSSQAFWISGEGLAGLDGASCLCALDGGETQP
jgi:hypothetical protein